MPPQSPTPMPTIAEILASKQAKAAAAEPTQPTQPVAPRESLAEMAEAKAAIDRIDPPGKSAVATAARKSAGLILNRELPAPPQPEPSGPDLPRALGQTEGEAIDMTPLAADPCIKDWHKAVTAFSTELCLVRDPVDPERAWLAVRLDEDPMHPLLLKDLMLYEHPRTQRPPNEPF